jgi:DNA polymerase-4
MIRQKSTELAYALERWTPLAGMASVDEAYLDMTGTEALYHNEPLSVTARRMQADIKERTTLDVSIGGGANRLVAKLATSFAKPAGVYIVEPGQEEAFVARLEISDLLGIGPAFRENLRRRGITTMTALLAIDLETMTSWWGPDRANWLWRRARGIDSAPVRSHEGRKSISSVSTFPRDVSDERGLERALLGQVVSVASSLRKSGLYARTVAVKLRDTEFNDRSRARTLADPVQTDRAIFAAARSGFAAATGSTSRARTRLRGGRASRAGRSATRGGRASPCGSIPRATATSCSSPTPSTRTGTRT